MSEKSDRDKFLTELVGECWHDEYSHEGPTFQERYDKYVCLRCGFEVSYTPSFYKMNFSTWENFGKLWKFAQKQNWWNDFRRDYCLVGGWKGWSFDEDIINPDKLADAIYNFHNGENT